MTFLLLAIFLGLAALTVWGVIAPRSQWRALAGATRRDPYDDEPSSVAIGIQRTVAAVALVALVVTGMSLRGPVETAVATKPAGSATPSPTPSSVASLWGSKDQKVVNRVFTTLDKAPIGLVSEPVLRYQAIDGPRRDPSYLFLLEHFKRPHAKARDGYIGSTPTAGLTALDTADLVVQVRGDRKCIPYQVAIVETESTIKVGVYYGQPTPPGSDNSKSIAQCTAELTDANSFTVLIPIDLVSPVQKRTVMNFAGTGIPQAGDNAK